MSSFLWRVIKNWTGVLSNKLLDYKNPNYINYHKQDGIDLNWEPLIIFFSLLGLCPAVSCRFLLGLLRGLQPPFHRLFTRGSCHLHGDRHEDVGSIDTSGASKSKGRKLTNIPKEFETHLSFWGVCFLLEITSESFSNVKCLFLLEMWFRWQQLLTCLKFFCFAGRSFKIFNI